MIKQDIRLSGSLASTNNRITVACGFQPRWVELCNTARVVEGKWQSGMPSDSMIRRSGNANPAYLTTSGITVVSDGTQHGFTIGPDSQLNPTGSDNLIWIAVR